MISFSDDIYKGIMFPIGLRYLVDLEENMSQIFFSPKNKPNTWYFIYSKSLSNTFEIAGDTAIYEISNGKFDYGSKIPKYYINNLEKTFCDNGLHYKELYNRLETIIRDSAATCYLISLNSKSKKSVKIDRVIINSLYEKYGKEVENKKKDLINALSDRLSLYITKLADDKRIKGSPEKHKLIKNLLKDNPIRLLGLLCILAIFPEDEKDFADELFKQYSIGVDIGCKPIRNTNSGSIDLTSFINITEESVLFREAEYNEIEESLKNNKGIVLSGVGGRGKTSLARLFYSKNKEKYDYCGWINYNKNLKTSMISDIKLNEYSDKTMTESDIKKKWNYIVQMLANSENSKLFVIDNVDYIEGIQSPLDDEDLVALSGWNNIKVIITSRFQSIAGYDNVISIRNLGDKHDYDKCIELFYYYNPEALVYRDTNYDVIKKVCELAGYNTMCIELLAKASRYDAEDIKGFYNNLIENGIRFADEVPVETYHDYKNIEIVDDDGTIKQNYYKRGKETASSQLMKLFYLKQRSPIERQILWDFHCLPEAEKVSKTELKNWLGYSINDIDSLKEESWIKYEDGFFFMHPLIKQAIKCDEEDWNRYWILSEERRHKEKTESLITCIKEHTFFKESGSFELEIRKIYFADYLSYEGRFFQPQELLYIADFSRKRGIRDIACKYYKKAYDKLSDIVLEQKIFNSKYHISEIDGEQLETAKLFWKSAYYYGYILSYTRNGYDEAEKYLTLAVTVIQELFVYLSDEEKYDLLSMSMDHLGYVKCNNHNNKVSNFVNACMLYRAAITYREKLVKKYPNNLSYLRDLAWSLDNLGTLFAMADYDALEKDDKNDSSLCIKGKGTLYSYRDEYEFFMNSEDKAEKYLTSSLNIRMELADKKGDKNSTEVAWTLCNIASLLSKDPNRYEDAEKFINKALDIYYELDKEYPEQHSSSLARTYTAYGNLLLKCNGRREDAIEVYNKALGINESLEREYPGVYCKEIEVLKHNITFLNSNLKIKGN